MNFRFLFTKFAFTEFQNISTFGQTFGLWLHRPSAAKVEAEGEKPSTSAKDLWPLVDRCEQELRNLGKKSNPRVNGRLIIK